MTGRIPVLDVHPVVSCGTYPATAVVGEEFDVSATVFREGHDAVRATAVLVAPDGEPRLSVAMRPGAPGTDRPCTMRRVSWTLRTSRPYWLDPR